MLALSGNLICASFFTGVYDVNRNQLHASDDFQVIEKWVRSVRKLGLQGIVFHNNFSEKTLSGHEDGQIQFFKVAFDTLLNANVYRYLVYFDFLKKYGHQVQHIFFTDIADVEVVKDPFTDPFFLKNSFRLFCGDEEEILSNPWMKDHCTHLRNQIPEFYHYEKENKSETLLNCGVIGGRKNVVLELLTHLVEIHTTHTSSNKTPFTLDMGAFNYVARTKFGIRLIHGFPVNTRFKGYESKRVDCWFRHK